MATSGGGGDGDDRECSGGGGSGSASGRPNSSRYESQKRRDWQTFVRYLAAHRPPLVLRRCSGAHVLEFLRYLDRFGKTRVHAPHCAAYGVRSAPAATATSTAFQCQCPLRQAWGSLDALVGRLRAAFDERHGRAGGGGQQQQHGHDTNPFAARAIRLYLRDVRDAQSMARGISYHKNNKTKKKKQQQRKPAQATAAVASSSSRNGGGHYTSTAATNAAAPSLPPLPPCLAGVPFEHCCVDEMGVSIIGGGVGAAASNVAGGIYLPLLFTAFSS